MNVFSRGSNKLTSAKDYIERKKYFNLFYDLSNNSLNNKVSVVRNNKISRINNHENLIRLTKGFYDYHQSGKCRDVSDNLQTTYEVEKFTYNECNVIKNTEGSPSTVSNGYNGYKLTNDESTDAVVNSSTTFIKHYAENNTTTGPVDNKLFTSSKKTETVNCIKLHTNSFKNI